MYVGIANNETNAQTLQLEMYKQACKSRIYINAYASRRIRVNISRRILYFTDHPLMFSVSGGEYIIVFKWLFGASRISFRVRESSKPVSRNLFLYARRSNDVRDVCRNRYPV